MTPSEGHGVEVKKPSLDLEEVEGGEAAGRAKDGVVGELMKDAKKAFRNRKS